MKSPWNLLARLIPQRRSAEITNEAIEPNPLGQESQALSSEPPLNPTKAVLGLENQGIGPTKLIVSPPDDVEGKAVPPLGVSGPDDDQALPPRALRSATRSGDQPHASPIGGRTRKRTSRATQTKNLESGTKNDIVTATRKPGSAKRAQAIEDSPSINPFFDEVAGLDDDIKKLKMQLAQKLHMQNVQLKKMLGRFDVS